MRDNNKRIQDNPESCIVHRASRITSAISRYFSLLTSHFSLRKMGSVPVFDFAIFAIIFVLVFLFNIFIYHGFSQQAWALDVTSKITDREIIESLSELKAGQKVIEGRIDSLDKRIDSLDKRIERLESVMIGGFGLLFTSMIGLVGFVLWDRRSALAPAIRKNRELEEREDRIEKALKEYAMEEPRLKEILKHLGLL